jgi:hypothetical protein
MQLPGDAQLTELIQSYAELHSQIGTEFGARPLVVPTSQFFPDVFQANEAGLNRLVTRMQRHAGLLDVPISVGLVEDASQQAESCSTSGCSKPAPSSIGPTLLPTAQGWRLELSHAQLGHPVALTTFLARILGAVFFEETRTEQTSLRSPADVTAELCAVALGFGPLLLEGAYVYSKSCGGPSVVKLTVHSPAELAIVTALFARQQGHSLRPALSAASPTQKAWLGLARDWESSNKHLAAALLKDPSALLTGPLKLHAPGPSWLSLFGRAKAQASNGDDVATRPEAGADLDALERQVLAFGKPSAPRAVDPAKADPTLAELRALVDSELSATRN